MPSDSNSCSISRHGELQVPFGLKEERLYEPLQVAKGIKCGCVCPGCGDAARELQEAEAAQLRKEAYAKEQHRKAEQEAAKQARAKAEAAEFKALSVAEKQLRIECAVKSPFVGWPTVTKVRNKAHAAIREPYGLWQGAVYFKFLKPGKTAREVHVPTIAAWLATRFHVNDGDPTVRQALSYYLAVMANQGLLRKGLFGRYEVMPEGEALPAAKRPAKELSAEAYIQHRPRILHWQAPNPIGPRLRSYAEMFCNTQGFSAVKLMPLLGSSETKLIDDYASPRQAAVALMRYMGGSEEIWLNFLCGAGIATEG